MKNPVFIVLIVVLAIFTSFLLFKNSFFLSPGSESGKSDVIDNEYVSCVSFDSNMNLEPNSQIPILSVNLENSDDPPGDCVIYSLAVNNWRRNPAVSLQTWYDVLRVCAEKNGLYTPATGAVPLKVEDICKAPFSSTLGRPETFVRVYADIRSGYGRNPNPIDCPPFAEGEEILISLRDSTETKGHSVTCNLLYCGRNSQTLDCTDREYLDGYDFAFNYILEIGKEGFINSQNPSTVPSLVGWRVKRVSLPNI